MTAPLIEIRNLSTCFHDQWVHRDLNLSINAGEIVAIVGGSGSGKSTLLRCLLMLQQPSSGEISLFGESLSTASDAVKQTIRQRWGVMFQQTALFSSLTVLENVLFPMRELTTIDPILQIEMAMVKLAMSGLDPKAAHKYPAELSGGMKKRAALARALILDPPLLILDEPVAGLDPKSTHEFDELITALQATLGLTVLMVSHDMASVKRLSTKVAFIGEGKVLAYEPYLQVILEKHPIIRAYFSGLGIGEEKS